ncbi:MAG: phosphotransferase enzyme family protein [Phycisphaerales bacterium]
MADETFDNQQPENAADGDDADALELEPDGDEPLYTGRKSRPRKPERAAPASSNPTQPPHLGPRQDDATHRDRMSSHELATVLSHYDIGIIERLREYPRGSRRSPKVRILTRTGEYLLKRRSPAQNPYRVAFSHRLQLHLADSGFPVARLIGTRSDNNSMVQQDNFVYEMFEYVRGQFFCASNRESQYAGFTMGRLHGLLAAHEIIYNPPEGTYHAAPGIFKHIAAIPQAVTTVDVDADEADLLATCAYLRNAYEQAVAHVDAAGFNTWQKSVIHGDWHPGNLLFNDAHKVIAVLDFDSARLEHRTADLANGALQFAMLIGDTDDPLTWPDGLASERLRAFVRGYDQAARVKLSDAELSVLPWLIVEALVAESVVPIAQTGRFARLAGQPFLTMIERKVRWIEPRAEKLCLFLKE